MEDSHRIKSCKCSLHNQFLSQYHRLLSSPCFRFFWFRFEKFLSTLWWLHSLEGYTYEYDGRLATTLLSLCLFFLKPEAFSYTFEIIECLRRYFIFQNRVAPSLGSQSLFPLGLLL